MVKLAAFSVTWYMARVLFLGVECDPLKPEKFCQVFYFLLYDNRYKIQEFVFCTLEGISQHALGHWIAKTLLK